MLVIFVPFGLALNTLLLWPILSLDLVLFYVFAVLFLPAAAILFVFFERVLVGSIIDSNQIVAIGSWTWFRQQVIHHATLLVWGYPLFAFQSSHFPTDLLRLAGADIGPRSIHFSKDPAFELSTTPLSLLSIGSDALITTYAILNCQNIRCGQWTPNAVQIGRGCLIGNNSLLELRGSSLPAHCWVGALSHAKLTNTQTVDEGQVLVGRPAQPLPLKAAADLTESAAQLPGRPWLLLVSWLWAQLVRVIFPSAPEAYLVFIFFWTSSWSFAYALGIAFACLGGAILCTLLFATLIGNVMGRCVVTPDNHFDMFSFKWFTFHWIDMSLLAVNANEPAFFGESEVWSWLMRLVGSDVGSNVLITDPYLVEPLLTSIGDNVVIDEGWTQPHVYSAHTLNIDHVAVCNAAELRDHSCALLLSTVGARATLGADSLLMRGERLPDGHTWQGVPALPM
jgi:non-ribosomal peptide synthetase-like protein